MIRTVRLLLIVTLVGCAGKQTVPVQQGSGPAVTPQPLPGGEPLSERGNHSPYRVFGKTYHVLPTSRGYVEQGIASWYGKKFHGRPTSSMEPFDMYQMTAAHKSLPLPTYARVTNLENDRSIVVRVNDRGPFKGNRIIDLSFAAARELDMVQQGTALVEVRALVPDDAAFDRPLVASSEQLYLQLGAFSTRENALDLVGQLRRELVEKAHVVTRQNVHRVRIGPLPSAERADELTATLILLGMEKPVVIFE